MNQVSTKTEAGYLDEPETPAGWLIRLLKGILVGVGFILPGLSGGVLAVIFRIYDPTSKIGRASCRERV